MPHAASTTATLNALPLPAYRAKLWHPNPILTLTLTPNSPSTLTLETASTLPSHIFRACFDLIATTSKSDYEASSMGWSAGKKKREMKLSDLRYVIVLGPESQVQGFMSFMLTVEDGCEVIYLYEIHLDAGLRGQGLGRRLVGLMEEVGRRAGVGKSMLTVFRRNGGARGFYGGLGYGVDEGSPRGRRLRGGVFKEADYLILSKRLGGGEGGGREGVERRIKRRKVG